MNENTSTGNTTDSSGGKGTGYSAGLSGGWENVFLWKCRIAPQHIQDYILPGRHIVSDGWPAYANIDTIQSSSIRHILWIPMTAKFTPKTLRTCGCGPNAKSSDSLAPVANFSRPVYTSSCSEMHVVGVTFFLTLWCVWPRAMSCRLTQRIYVIDSINAVH